MQDSTTLTEMVSAQVEEVERVVRQWREGKGRDVGSLEVQIREFALRVGREFMERLVRGIAEQSGQKVDRCPTCKSPVESKGLRAVQMNTSMGEVGLDRRYLVCTTCSWGGCPLDRELGLDEQHNSPALQRMVSLAGAVGPFEKASELLGEIGSIPMGSQKVERITEQIGSRVEAWLTKRQHEGLAGLLKPEGPGPKRLYAEADGTTVPMRVPKGAKRSSDQRVKGKVEYKEVKLGAIFDATVDEKGQPQIGRKTYTGTFGDAETCVRQVLAEGKARGSDQAEEIVALTDGGKWLWNRLPEAFAGKKVTEILDWCHPSEKLGLIARLVFGEGATQAQAWADEQRALLYDGHADRVIEAMERLRPKTGEAKDSIRHTLGYFREHMGRMNYGELRAQGYFIGSGVIESACKHIVNERFKRAGMKWSRDHVPKLLALRVCRASGWWDQFWRDSVRGAAA